MATLMLEGVDISEHQAGFPPGRWDFVIIRTVNEAGREDRRWRAHKAEADRRGVPAGAYVIVQPGRVDADAIARTFLRTLAETSWALIPWVDVELPGGGLRGYVQRVRDVIKASTHVVGGYYSAGSHYRQQTADLFDRQWLAAWGGREPGGADVWQYQGHPLDRNRCHDLNRVRWGATPATTPAPTAPPPPGGGDDDMTPAEMDDQLLVSLRGNNEIRAELMSIQAAGLLFILRGNPEVRAELASIVREATR